LKSVLLVDKDIALFNAMTNTTTVPRNLIILGIVVPLAAFLGFCLATSDRFTSWIPIGLVVGALAIPIFLRWHHPILIVSWNAAIQVFFLPGQPKVWMAMVAVSLGISVLNRLLDKEKRFVHVPVLTWTLIFFAAVILITMAKTGGIGMRVLGSGTFGGRRYMELLLAIAGYFALTAQRVPPARGLWIAGLFLLPSITLAMSNIIYFLGPGFFWLYWIFPVGGAMNQAMADYSVSGDVYRLTGLAFACLGPYLYMLARFGVRGILDMSNPWRLAVVILLAAMTLFGGFRALVVLLGLAFVIQFFLEGLWRTRLFPALLLAGLVSFVAIIPISNKLPQSVQRTLSFLPFMQVDPVVRYNAMDSTAWRLIMWKMLIPDLPKYVIFGKGYAVSATEMYLAHQSMIRGLTSDLEPFLLAGDYHSGPLSIYVPFGSLGTLAFVAFLFFGFRVLRANWKYGDPRLRTINTLLLAYFVTRIVFFIFVFGAISDDLVHFVGIVGMSVCLNAGRAKPEPKPILQTPQLQPAPA
jgi:hypothetical protein